MTAAIVFAALVLVIDTAIVWGVPHSYDYHTDLKNIAYQLSRIADALNRKDGDADER